jgi:enolase
MLIIKSVRDREVLDSWGNLMVEVAVTVNTGERCTVAVECPPNAHQGIGDRDGG